MNVKTSSLFILVLSAVLTIVISPTIWAEEASANEAAETTTKQPTETADNKPTPTKIGKKKDSNEEDGKIFRPSEEISEDFAVSFPVDI